jgi:hypothetical protein
MRPQHLARTLSLYRTMKTAQNVANQLVAHHAYHARAQHGYHAEQEANDAHRYTNARGSFDVDSFDTMNDTLSHFSLSIDWYHEPF